MSYLETRSDKDPPRAVSPWLAFMASPDSHSAPTRISTADPMIRSFSLESENMSRDSRSCSLDDNGSISKGSRSCSMEESESLSNKSFSDGEAEVKDTPQSEDINGFSTGDDCHGGPELSTSTGVSSEEEEVDCEPLYRTQRLEKISRSITIPSDPGLRAPGLRPPGLRAPGLRTPDMRRRTLPAMMVTSYSGGSEEDEEEEEEEEEDIKESPSSLHGASLRSGFRRRGQRRRKNYVRKNQSVTLPYRPYSAGHRSDRPSVIITADPHESSGTNLNKNFSRSTGHLISDEETTEPPKSPRSKHLLGDLGASPSPRRRSSLLVAISGMLSKSQTNLVDIGEDSEPSKVFF